ncbi:MAG: hypothetical protein BAA04_11280, partial [Firmicutes bacterium ZCTH02-B6]
MQAFVFLIALILALRPDPRASPLHGQLAPARVIRGYGGAPTLVIPLLIFVITLVLILWRPRGIREAWFAAAGAMAMFCAGAVDGGDVRDLALETAPVLLFLVGMLAVGYVADRAGVFVWLAQHTARLSGGSGRRLFVGLYAVGVVVTVWFSLDTTAVILAPIVYSLVQALGLPPLPFVLATTYVANTASLLLPVSNLTNLIVWNRFHIPFWGFAAAMAVPALAAIAVNLVLFLWLFRRDIPARFPVNVLAHPAAETAAGSDPAGRATAQRRLTECLVILGLLLTGIAAAPFFGWELWEVALAGALALTVHGAVRGYVRLRELAGGISWDLMPFVFSLFLVLRGVGNSGLSEVFSSVLARGGATGSFGGLLVIAATTALGSNLINNLPMVLVAADSLTAPVANGQVGMASVYAALLGTNLGPNLTVIGSLATMLALSIVGSKGMRVSGVQYLKIGAVTVPLLLLGSVLGLWL